MKKLVVLTGAGVSAESGLQTFRDHDGLWEGYNVEDVATIEAWHRQPRLVLDFYNQRRQNVRMAQPNRAHYIIAELQQNFDVTVVTQNIDDLHERAGSGQIIHLHGEIMRMKSETDETLTYPVSGNINFGDKADDGAQLRPDVVWFGEPVPKMYEAMEVVKRADIFAIVGTSLMVYPAAGLADLPRRHAQRYIVDKKIPRCTNVHLFTTIEKPATEGMAELQQILLSNI